MFLIFDTVNCKMLGKMSFGCIDIAMEESTIFESSQSSFREAE